MRGGLSGLVHQLEVQDAQRQDLDLAGVVVEVAGRKQLVEVVEVVEVVEEQVGHSNEPGEAEEAAAGHSKALVFCLEVAAAAEGQESKEFDCELVGGAGAAEVRLVEAPFALEAAEVLAERSQLAEGVAGAQQEPTTVAWLLPLLEMGIGGRRGAGLFFGWVVEAAWCPCSVERELRVVFSL